MSDVKQKILLVEDDAGLQSSSNGAWGLRAGMAADRAGACAVTNPPWCCSTSPCAERLAVRRALTRSLAHSDGSIAQAAELLGVTRPPCTT